MGEGDVMDLGQNHYSVRARCYGLGFGAQDHHRRVPPLSKDHVWNPTAWTPSMYRQLRNRGPPTTIYIGDERPHYNGHRRRHLSYKQSCSYDNQMRDRVILDREGNAC